MDFEILYLLGVYLVPLAFVSFVGAWASSRRPVVAVLLCVAALGVFGYIYFARDEGLFDWRAIPDMTVMLIARLIALF